MIRCNMQRSGLIGLALTTVSLAHSVSSASVQIDVTTFATGEDQGVAIVAKLVVTQNGANVDFVLTNLVGNLPGDGLDTCISKLGFAYQGAAVLDGSSIINLAGTQVPLLTDFDFDSNIPGGYDFPITLSFPTSNGGGGDHRFKNGEIATWTIKNVLESDFTGKLVPGSGNSPLALAGVHIQSLASGGSTTYTGLATTVVPEGSSLSIWVGLSLVSLCVARRQMRR